MRQAHSRRQRGIALIAFLAIVAIGVSALILKHLNDASGLIGAARKNRNAEVLIRAKQALIGYVAHQAAVSGENNPGAFPCPEAPAGYGSFTGTDGRTQTPSCTLPAVGRFPWRTIGTDMLVDSAGEPLWYVVASGWSKPSATGNTVINSNCTDATSAMTCYTGQLTVDGAANAAVALIIAPGAAFNVPAAANCAAVNQARPASGAPNLQNYLECQNATNPADATFVTTGPSGSFNDQVVKITAAEVLPAIEAAVADRFQKEIAPKLRTAYSGGNWPATPVLPFAVAFADPTVNPANKLQGSAGTTQGLFPGNYAFAESSCTCDAPDIAPCVCKLNTQGQRSLEPCTIASDPRCDPAFVTWRASAPCGSAVCTTVASTSGVTLQTYLCTVAGAPATLTCVISGSTDWISALLGLTSMTINLDATASNAGMTLRQVSSPTNASRAPQVTGIDTSYLVSPFGYSVAPVALNSDGSATIRLNTRFAAGSGSVLGVLGALTCNFFGIPLCYQYTVSVPMALLSDHPVVDPNNTTYNWFYRNKWHEVSYYAVASGIAPSGARSCTTSVNCLQVTYHPDNGKHRGILVIGGPKLGSQVRPATVLSDLFEGANAGGVSPFEKRSTTLAPNRTFNDHFAVIDSN